MSVKRCSDGQPRAEQQYERIELHQRFLSPHGAAGGAGCGVRASAPRAILMLSVGGTHLLRVPLASERDAPCVLLKVEPSQGA